MPPPPRAIVVHAATWEDVREDRHRYNAAAPARPGVARSHSSAAVARCSAPVAAAVFEGEPSKVARAGADTAQWHLGHALGRAGSPHGRCRLRTVSS